MYNRDTTAYLGDENSYSHTAAKRLVSGALKGYDTMQKVIAAVGEDCARAVLPVENNVEGAVNEVYDALFDRRLYISRQLVLPVRHSLIAAEGANVSTLKKIASHPQAIAQCRAFLSKLDVPVVAVSSTSDALKLADKTTAALAYKPRDGQIVLAKNVQDSAFNATRFALVSREKPSEATGDKASVAFDLDNVSGALVRVLEKIADCGVNMTRIVSRPHRSGDGRYRFFVDLDFFGSDAELRGMMDGIESYCTDFRFLGRYDCVQADE